MTHPTDGERKPNRSDGWGAEAKSKSFVTVIVDQFPTVALGLNALAVLLWVSGTVSFELAVLTILLVTSATITDQH